MWIGWATVIWAAIVGAYGGFSQPVSDYSGRPTLTPIRLFLFSVLSGLALYLFFSRGAIFVWLSFGFVTLGSFVAQCRRTNADRFQCASDLSCALGFFSLGAAELINLQPLAIAAFALIAAGWLILMLKPLLQRAQHQQ